MSLDNYQKQLEFIVNANTPILFIDTCAYLDVLRMVHRDDMSFDDLDALYDLVQLITENKLLFITSEIVRDEFFSNHRTTLDELNAKFKTHKYFYEKMIKTKVRLSINTAEYVSAINGDWITVLDELCQKNIKNNSIIFEKTDSDKTKAFDRVYAVKSPAKQGKDSLTDCLIFETLLRVVGNLRQLGFDKKVCFISSNTKDFGKVRNCFVQDDLNKLNILFANHFSHAKSLLI